MRHAKAESLIETLVAITIIVIATVSALSIMRTTLRGNELIQDKVIAINLAEEAFEALKNIRDTNYLLFASDPDTCWNRTDATDVSTCSSATRIQSGVTYYLTRDYGSDPLYKWTLSRVTGSTNGFISLYDVDLDGDGNYDSQMYAESNVHYTGLNVQSGNSDLFKRRISITYNSADSFDAAVTITWLEEGAIRTLTLTRSINNVY